MSGLSPQITQGLVVFLFAAGLVTATMASVLYLRLRRDMREVSELKFEPASKPKADLEAEADGDEKNADEAAEDVATSDDDAEETEDDQKAAQEELERLKQEKAKADAEKRREEYWREAEEIFVRFTKSLTKNPEEPLIYTFIPFGLGMGIAALFESRIFIVQSGSKRLGIPFDKIRRFKFVFVGSGRYDLHVFVSSIETPRLVVAQLDIASMDRWNEVYLRIKEGRL